MLQLLYFSSVGDLSATRYRAPVEMTVKDEGNNFDLPLPLLSTGVADSPAVAHRPLIRRYATPSPKGEGFLFGLSLLVIASVGVSRSVAISRKGNVSFDVLCRYSRPASPTCPRGLRAVISTGAR